MSELIVLSLDRDSFLKLHQRAKKGDQAALASIAQLWDEYRGRSVACFICDETVEERPIGTIALPEFNDNQKLIGAPLCAKCNALPPLVKSSRSLRVLQRMFSARAGKNIHFQFSRAQHHPMR
jgi:hypothetical protein